MSIVEKDEMKEYKYEDQVFSFEGCISVKKDIDSVSPWRIKCEEAELYPTLYDHIYDSSPAPIAAQCSGVRLTFCTNTPKIILKLKNVVKGQKLDLYVDNKFTETVELVENADRASFENLSDNKKKIEIWLDQGYAFCLKSILANKEAFIKKYEADQKRWIHYGSSISHSREGDSPSHTWGSIVARKQNLHLTNLGFGGNCIIEPMIARIIRDVPAEFITLKLGINVHSGALNIRSFAPNVIGFIQIIREKNKKAPIFIISPIISPEREDTRIVETGLSLKEMRNTLCKIVEVSEKYGDNNIHYIDGLKLFGSDEVCYLPDLLHPNAEGQQILATNFIKEVFLK